MAREVRILAHGTFDLLHIGHVLFLEQAKALGSWLIVSITNDAFVQKGPKRPVFPAPFRAYILSRLRCVDEVYFCNEASGVMAINAIQPDIYVKGQDYADPANQDARFLAEREAIEKLGGELRILEEPIRYSSTDLLSGKYA